VASAAGATFAGAVHAQEETLDEVTVVGVRSALQNALENKRNSDVIMDGISADDSGPESGRVPAARDGNTNGFQGR
jgi:hypothetical protein